MEIISPSNLIEGEFYYIESNNIFTPGKKSRQIGKCKCVSHFRDSIYNVSFTEIGEIEKRDGYGESDLHYGDGIRNSVWFTFYKIYRLDYQKKVEDFYKKAINSYLQQIIGDSNFIWYL